MKEGQILEKTRITRDEIVKFIQNYTAENGFAPTKREIQVHFGISSLSIVHNHLEHLKNEGRISYNRYRARTIVVL